MSLFSNLRQEDVPRLESLADREIRLSCSKCKEWHKKQAYKSSWKSCKCSCEYCSKHR